MEFWASIETHQPAYESLTRVRRAVEPFLNAAFSASSLKAVQGMLRYVPIVMPDSLRQHYPARSKLRQKERIYDCAPQLNYDVFVNGKLEEQLREYLSGIAQAGRHLAGLGASATQIKDFDRILHGAADLILAEMRRQETPH